MKYEKNVLDIINKHSSMGSGKNNVSIDADLKSIGIDSISFVKIIIEIEDFLGICIPLEKIEYIKINTARDICRIVSECFAVFQKTDGK